MFHGDVSPDIAAGILELRQKAITPANIPPSKLDETINIASWNIREFGKKARLEASVHYIAEIMGQFDLISIVELRKEVNDLERVVRILGPYWRVVYSDYIDDPGGNSERVAFVYDERAVAFTGFVGNAEERRAKVGAEWTAPYSWWRKPYMCGFMAGNFDFVMVATHIRWGAKEEERIPELALMADWVDRRRTVNFAKCDRKILYPGSAPAQGDRFTYELSDHLPLWIQIGTDWDDIRMDQILRPQKYDEAAHNISVSPPPASVLRRPAAKKAKRAAPKATAARKRK